MTQLHYQSHQNLCFLQLISTILQLDLGPFQGQFMLQNLTQITSRYSQPKALSVLSITTARAAIPYTTTTTTRRPYTLPGASYGKPLEALLGLSWPVLGLSWSPEASGALGPWGPEHTTKKIIINTPTQAPRPIHALVGPGAQNTLPEAFWKPFSHVGCRNIAFSYEKPILL